MNEPAISVIVPIYNVEKWVGDMLEFYKDRHFVNEDRTFDIHNLPVVFFEQLFGHYTFKAIDNKNGFCGDNGTISLFDSDFFNSRDYVGIKRSEKAYCAHCFAASWGGHQSGLRERLIRALPRGVANSLLNLHYNVIKPAATHRYDPIYRQEHP